MNTATASPPRRPRPVWLLLLPLTMMSVIAATFTALVLVGGMAAMVASVRVQVVIDGAASLQDTRAATVADLLLEQGITLNAFDRVQPAPEARLEEGMVVQIARSRRVQVVVDGVVTMVRTAAVTSADILDALGVSVSPGDRVLVDGVRVASAALPVWPGAPERIDVRHVQGVTVNDGGEMVAFDSTAATVGEALFEAGIPLYVSDFVEPPLYAPLPAS
ncbi:MAG TPA: ubiquitin-like domain-containing protein, partial [Candidatus Limnocylindrales bacterium]|nr:ubiquitin-like domain-containing protein [Candidatus Limnocylindrales bacterium]